MGARRLRGQTWRWFENLHRGILCTGQWGQAAAACWGQESLGDSSFMGTAGSYSYCKSDPAVPRPLLPLPLTPCTFSICCSHGFLFLTWLQVFPSSSFSVSPCLQIYLGEGPDLPCGKKYLQRNINFRGSRQMKIFSQSPRINGVGGQGEQYKGKQASKCKYLLKSSVKSKPPASQQLAGSVATASEVTAQEQAGGRVGEGWGWDEHWQQREAAC